MKEDKRPIFYLTTAGEYKLLSKPRACWFAKRLRDINRDDYMLVTIDPPLIGQPFGLGDTDIEYLILSTRHQGSSLYPVKEWPTSVYVARIRDRSLIEEGSFVPNQIELIAWGEILNNLEKATARAQELEPELT